MLHIMCLITKWGGRALFGLSVGLLALYTCIIKFRMLIMESGLYLERMLGI